MSSQQKAILIVLALVNVLCFCCGLPLALLFLSGDSSGTTTAFFPEPSPTPTKAAPTLTLTPLPSSTPQATATRVIPLSTTRNITGVTATRGAISATATKTKTPSPTATAQVSNPYDIFIPTPTTPPLAYPIDFQSTINLVTYAVTGKTFNEINASLDNNPLNDPNERNNTVGLTASSLKGHWFLTETARGCEVDHGTVTVAITITLPALKTTTGVPADVVNRWNTFVRYVSAHEQTHERLSLEGARTYQRDLGNFLPAPNCDTLKTQLDDLFDRDSDAIKRVNAKYDAEAPLAVFP